MPLGTPSPTLEADLKKMLQEKVLASFSLMRPLFGSCLQASPSPLQQLCNAFAVLRTACCSDQIPTRHEFTRTHPEQTDPVVGCLPLVGLESCVVGRC